MKCASEIHPETLEYLARLRSFIVQPCPRAPDFNERVPAHTKVVRPLLAEASEAFVWPPSNKQRTVSYPSEILSAERGRYRFDLSRDVVTGNEPLWNATAWARGSIAVRLPRLPDNFVEVLMHCSCTPPAVFASRSQLAKGDSGGAIRYCDSVIDSGEFAFLFSASNGIEQLSIFAPVNELERVYRLALEWCRPFKRWFECVPGESVNLVEAGNR